MPFWIILFWISAALNIAATLTERSWLVYFSKPLLLISLSIYFYHFSKGLIPSQFRYFMLLGLFFSIGGDSFLMFQSQNSLYFLLGLGCFLITQICYTIAFVSYRQFQLRHHYPIQWLWVLVFVFYWSIIVAFVVPDVSNEFRIPIVLYSLVITAMAISCAHLKDCLTSNVWRLLFAGVLLFLISDSLIAINKFKMPIVYSSLWIMSTYIIAQYLIATQAIKILQRK